MKKKRLLLLSVLLTFFLLSGLTSCYHNPRTPWTPGKWLHKPVNYGDHKKKNNKRPSDRRMKKR